MRLLAAAFAVALAVPQDPPKPEISWNLKAGEPVRYEVEKTTVILRKTGDLEMKMKLGLVLEAGARDAEGKLPLRFRIDRVGMSGKGDKDDEDYDSDRDKAAPKHPALHLMAGCLHGEFEARLSRQGNVSGVQGLREILQNSADNVPAMKDSGDKEVASRFASSIDQILQEAFCLAPGKALAKSDAWDASPGAIAYGNGETTLRIKSTVKDIRGGEAVIERTLTLDFTGDQRNPEGKGSGKGEVVWSTERGLPLSGQWEYSVTTSRGETRNTFSLKLAPRPAKK